MTLFEQQTQPIIYKLKSWILITIIYLFTKKRNYYNSRVYKLLKSDLINYKLSSNPNAIDLLRQNPNKINWEFLSSNPNAIDLLKEHPDKINWYYLSSNPNAIDLLRKNPNKISWMYLSENPNAIDLLRENPYKINWCNIFKNPNIFEPIYNYNFIIKRIEIFKEELLSVSLSPERIIKWIKQKFLIIDLFYYKMDKKTF